MTLARYDLQKGEELNRALQELMGFWKLWSACLLSACGLPTLKGILLIRPYKGISEDVHRFLTKTKGTVALIRHDKKPEVPPYPRGGFLVPEILVKDVINFFFSLNRIVAIYEPANPLLNAYNINLLFESEKEVSAEVLGSGFDASDLQRGDLSPHESFFINISPAATISKIKLVRRVDQAGYEESVILRKKKIKRKIETAPSPDLAALIWENSQISENLDTYLKAIGSPLSKVHRYRPIPKNLLQSAINKVLKSDIIRQYRILTGANFPLVFSTSWVNPGQKLVYWDIVSPALKFEGLGKKKMHTSRYLEHLHRD